MKNFWYKFMLVFLLSASALPVLSQLEIDYTKPKEYEIAEINVNSNSDKLDKAFVQLLAGLRKGQLIKIPGDDISEAIEKLWKEKVFSNIAIYATKVEYGKIWLEIYVEERPRVSSFSLVAAGAGGMKKGESDDIKELLDIRRSDVVTEYLMNNITYLIKDYYAEKNFLNVNVDYETIPDTSFLSNSCTLKVYVDRGAKVKVGSFTISGNQEIKKSKIRRAFSDAIVEKSRIDLGKDLLKLFKGEVKFREVDSTVLESSVYEAGLEYFRNAFRVNIFKASKYVATEVEAAKMQTIALFNAKGYRDARFIKDSIYLENGEIHADFEIEAGRQYYLRKIDWIGNQLYTAGRLDTLLGFKRGDLYDQDRLDRSLRFNPSGFDISSLYQDNGYLFFQLEPVEVLVEGDSVDLEIRMYEGKQARIKNIKIIGNTKTNDHVVLRELWVKPGDLFNRSDLIRSQQALAALGYFDPQQMDVRPVPNPADGTVDLEFIVTETPSDQIELSGGWGAGQIIGTLGLSFNNFSLKNMFRKKSWNPVPAGDGQKLSIRAQSNGIFYQNYSFSFTEPWLGGKKPITFSLFTFHTRYTFGGTDTATATNLYTTSVGTSIGSRLKWPDNYTQVLFNIKYNHYEAKNYRLFSVTNETFTGSANNFSLGLTIGRYSSDDPIFPSSGSNIQFSVEATPPYSLFTGKDFTGVSSSERYKLLEYHKWKFKLQWFVSLTKNKKFVMMARADGGFIGSYNPTLGSTPFERFFLGGDGLSGFALDGREIIALRGYSNNSLTPGYDPQGGNATGGLIFSKYTLEFRYLISPNPQAKIFALAFMEAGNSWESWDEFTPFQVNKSAGVGIRLFLPAFGLLGVDYGWGFDPVRGLPESQRTKGMFHFMIGQQF